MKRLFNLLLVILVLLITSCGLSAEEIATQTSTASTAIAASWTKTPNPTLTLTPTFTPTLTPTSTMTPTITPTPLGGGSGQISCLGCGGNGLNGIYIVKSDGTGAIHLTDFENLFYQSSFEWSGDGTKLAYLDSTGSGEQRQIYACIIDVSKDNEKKCLDVRGEFELSPDATELAVENSDGITIINIESGEKRTLVEGAYDYYGGADWSSDGTKFVYVKKHNLYTINVDGSDETRIVSDVYRPVWSPDGTQIAYISGFFNPQNIIVMRADGTNKVILTSNLQVYTSKMKWSADGKYIVFQVITAGDRSNPETDLYVVEVASQKVLRLTNDHNVREYFLSPDGTKIAVTTHIPTGASSYTFRSYIINIDGTVLFEWKDFAIVGPWRP